MAATVICPGPGLLGGEEATCPGTGAPKADRWRGIGPIGTRKGPTPPWERDPHLVGLRSGEDGASIDTIGVDGGQYQANEGIAQTASQSSKLTAVITDVQAG